ncbi:MAG: TonB-dependent receptor [Candidatus Omnitrophica bacterium]|nr:TonB-dependent receptor [Candidatus Omnitrophota bacterium]
MKQRHSRFFLIILLTVLFAACLHSEGFAKDTESAVYYLEPVVVYPSLIDEYCANSLRHITFIDSSRQTSSQSLTGSLDQASVLDIAQRGVFDIQSDWQIRGASFEQTDFLINGVKVNDPQTGHFSADIPFFIDDFDKVILISGPSAAVNAASRQGGSISFVTKKPTVQKKQEIKASSVFGDNDYSNQMLSVSYPAGSIFSRTSAGITSSSGYRYNTDFRTLKISHASFLENSFGKMEFIFGFMDKEFGANGFYSEFFPGQREFTKTVFTSLGLKSDWENLYFNPQVYMRRHEDRFLLDRSNPSFYENLHTNRVLGAKLDMVHEFPLGEIFFGVDIAAESIDSSSLGDRQRQRNTLYSVYSGRIGRTILSLGATGYFHEAFEDVFVPELSGGYMLSDNLKLRSSFSQASRVPTFTELYYSSPANIGNPSLVPEESNNYELGADYAALGFSIEFTVFRRKGENLIDWVREKSQTVYEIRNVSRVTTEGIDAGLKIYPEGLNEFNPALKGFSFEYSYVRRNSQENELVSKYVFDYLKHKFVLAGEFLLPHSISSKAEMQYLQRIDNAGDFIVNTSFVKEIKSYNIFINIDNLFNHSYSRKADIPMPGRWIFAGVKVSW